MGLKIWLPFDGDLHNQGVSDLSSPTNNTLTLQNTGKIGKCYSGQAVWHLANEILNNTWSLCAWIKADSWYSSNNIILCKNVSAGDTYQFYFSIVKGNQVRLGINNHDGIYFNYTFNTGTWYHLAATYDGNIGSIYINGELKTTGTVTNNYVSDMNNIGINCRSSNAGGTSRWVGDSSVHYINDIRIYDHCLSAAEVREISQGLILHYKLDDITNGVQDSSGYNHNGTLYDSANITINNTNQIRYENYCSFGSSLSAINAGKSTYINSSLTYNVWARTSSALASGGGLLSSVQTYGAGFKANASKLYFSVYDNGQSKFISVYSDKTTTQLADGEWHMYTGVYNEANKTNRLYIDGVEQADVKSVVGPLRYNTSTVLWVGAEAKASQTVPTTGWIGDISDVRIYVTALSHDDIMQLYQLGAKIDNQQNLHTFELNENHIPSQMSTVSTSYTSQSDTKTIFTYNSATSTPNQYQNYSITCNGTIYMSDKIFITPGKKYDFRFINNNSVVSKQYSYTVYRWERSGSSYRRVATGTTYGRYASYSISVLFYNNADELLGTTILKSETINEKRNSSYSSTTLTPIIPSTNNTITIPYIIIDNVEEATYIIVKEAYYGSTLTTTNRVAIREYSSADNIQIQKSGVIKTSFLKEATHTKFKKDKLIETNQLIEI